MGFHYLYIYIYIYKDCFFFFPFSNEFSRVRLIFEPTVRKSAVVSFRMLQSGFRRMAGDVLKREFLRSIDEKFRTRQMCREPLLCGNHYVNLIFRRDKRGDKIFSLNSQQVQKKTT